MAAPRRPFPSSSPAPRHFSISTRRSRCCRCSRARFGASTFEVGLTITAPTVAVALAAPLRRPARRSHRPAPGHRRLGVDADGRDRAGGDVARSLQQLIVWRFVQGVATPGIFASTIAYIHEVWPPSHAGRATAAYMSGTILGGFTGRAVCGPRRRRRELAGVVRRARDPDRGRRGRAVAVAAAGAGAGRRDATLAQPRAAGSLGAPAAQPPAASRPTPSASACCSRRWRCSPT